MIPITLAMLVVLVMLNFKNINPNNSNHPNNNQAVGAAEFQQHEVRRIVVTFMSLSQRV